MVLKGVLCVKLRYLYLKAANVRLSDPYAIRNHKVHSETVICRKLTIFPFQPERIDPKKREYDIRADVWSLGITLVELATGSFPYKGCNTDFEVLTRVLESDPPSLPIDKGFSIEFQTFVRKW